MEVQRITLNKTLNLSRDWNSFFSNLRQTHLPPETTTVELILKLIATIKQVGSFNNLNEFEAKFHAEDFIIFKTSNKTDFINKILNFEYELVNEKEQIPHKLLNEKYFVIKCLTIIIIEFDFVNFSVTFDSP